MLIHRQLFSGILAVLGSLVISGCSLPEDAPSAIDIIDESPDIPVSPDLLTPMDEGPAVSDDGSDAPDAGEGPSDPQLVELGGEMIPTLVYNGIVILPSRSAVAMDSIVVRGSVDETTPGPDGRFVLRMNEQATGLITAEIDGRLFMMAVFPKHPDLVRTKAIVSPQSTGIAMMALTPGVLSGDPRMDAIMLRLLETSDQVVALGDELDHSLSLDWSSLDSGNNLIIESFAAALSALADWANSGPYAESGGLRPCGLTGWPSADDTGKAFHDDDGADTDGLFLGATYPSEGNLVTLRITNPAARWASIVYETDLPGEHFVGLVSGRRPTYPGAWQMLDATVSNFASPTWNDVFGLQKTQFFVDLQSEFLALIAERLECAHGQRSGVAINFDGSPFLDTFSLGNGGCCTNAVVPAGLTVLDRMILPMMTTVLDIPDVADVQKIAAMTEGDVEQLGAVMAVHEDNLAGIALRLKPGQIDQGPMLAAVSDLTAAMLRNRDWWNPIQNGMTVGLDSQVERAIDTELGIFRVVLASDRWAGIESAISAKVHPGLVMARELGRLGSTDRYVFDTCRPDASEPNDSRETATNLSVSPSGGTAVLADLGICPEDIDFFHVAQVGMAGRSCTLAANLEYEPPATGSGANLRIRLFDANDTLLESSDGDNGLAGLKHEFTSPTGAVIAVDGLEDLEKTRYTIRVTTECLGVDPCGNGTCDVFEDETTCPVDCTCVPDCFGIECGRDPICGTICGSCGTGEICQFGVCVPETVEDETVLIPAGTFWMGCNSAVESDCGLDQLPYHEVYVSAFRIDRNEVTNDKFKECIAAGACTRPTTSGLDCDIPTDDSCNWGVPGRGSHPVNGVSWNQAEAYCAWTGQRLPTEAEWEKAARGTDGRTFPWGFDAATCNRAVTADCDATTHPICSRREGDSPWGLCDMAGNVFEWVSDYFSVDYYATSPYSDPQGPSNGEQRVIRGGAFATHAMPFTRVTVRGHDFQNHGLSYTGFRCVTPVAE